MDKDKGALVAALKESTSKSVDAAEAALAALEAFDPTGHYSLLLEAALKSLTAADCGYTHLFVEEQEQIPPWLEPLRDRVNALKDRSNAVVSKLKDVLPKS